MNNELLRALRPVKARLRRNRLLRGLAFGLAAGLAAALAVRVLSLWLPLERKWLWTLLPVPACALACALGNALRPVRDRDAATAADDTGLKERTVTALENAGTETEICRLQREDACAALRRLDVKRIRPGSVKKALLASLACLAVLAALLAVRTPADLAAENRTALRRTLREGSEEIARAAEEDGERLTKEERAELRRLTEDLDRDLNESRDEADALVALDRAEQRLEQLRAQTAGDALAAAAAAQQGQTGAGDGKQGTAEGSGQQASVPDGTTQQGAQAAAGGTQGTDSAARAAKTASALSALKTAVNPSLAQSGKSYANAENTGNAGSSGGQAGQTGTQGGGQGGAGSGGQGTQSGGGAGEGSTNLEQEGGGNSPGMHAAGTRDPQYKEEKYETIYDPERAEAARRDEITNQNRLGDEGSVQAETGPGKGRLGGDVPWGEAVGEYAETETRSAERENLTAQEKEWVKHYFTLLTEQSE